MYNLYLRCAGTLREARQLNGTTTYYIYDGEKPIVEYNSSNTIIARNVYGKGIDEILMRNETGINDCQLVLLRTGPRRQHDASAGWPQHAPEPDRRGDREIHIRCLWGANDLRRQLDTTKSILPITTVFCSPAANTLRPIGDLCSGVRVLRIPRPRLPSDAGPVHERRPEAVRCRRLQSLPLLPQ